MVAFIEQGSVVLKNGTEVSCHPISSTKNMIMLGLSVVCAYKVLLIRLQVLRKIVIFFIKIL